jgi:hypothetical protein
MKKLPIGTQSFSILRKSNYLYVDKTKYIYKMIEDGRVYFLSRPRRFGKSLMVSTLEELFKGNKELFEGLYIFDKWDWDENFPVIHLDFGELRYNTPEKLENTLNDFVNTKAREYDIKLHNSELNNRFSELIKEINKKFNKKVVVLVDEYDGPIIDNINNIQVADDNREILSSFYQVLKSTDDYLRFIFLTGVSKFSKTTIFSKLNNLLDITLNPNYTMICGYTQEEFENCFSEYIIDFSQKNNVNNETLLKLIKKWYNGYSWDGKNFLYNPHSVISFFNTGEFNNYWFDTGTPTFLLNILKEEDDNSDMDIFLNPAATFDGSFPEFDLNHLDLTTTLLQSGYLTVKDKKVELGELPVYNLGIPNKEVNESFYSYLLGAYTNKKAGVVRPLSKNILNYILEADKDNLNKSLDTLVANIPYSLHQKIEDKNEAYYHILFLSWMKLMGFDIQGEIQTSKGRIDALLKQEDEVVIIEIKYSKTKLIDKMLDEAMKQIEEKEYYKPYQDKNVTLLAIAFIEKEIACKIKRI